MFRETPCEATYITRVHCTNCRFGRDDADYRFGEGNRIEIKCGMTVEEVLQEKPCPRCHCKTLVSD